MFLTQVDSSYLLESVVPKVRDIISNLKPSSVGYKTAWDRLKKEYGQTRAMISAHLDEIINLPTIRGTNHEKIQEFYDKLSRNFDALQTLGEGEELQGFVTNTLNKLPHVKPDLVKVDSSWEEWEKLVWGDGKPKPKCIFCSEEHWSDECKRVVTRDQRKKFFVDKNLCFNCGRTGHRGSQCRNRGCFKCGSKHHTSICDKNQNPKMETGVYSMVTACPLRRIHYQPLFQSRFRGK
jgi:hypothetical protein